MLKNFSFVLCKRVRVSIMKQKMNWKDVVIGILVAYVVIDLLMAFVMQKSEPACLQKMLKAYTDQSGLVVILIGLVVGVAVWWLASTAKECFTRAKITSEEEKED